MSVWTAVLVMRHVTIVRSLKTSAVKVSYLSFFEPCRWVIHHVERYPSCLVDLLHSRVDSLILCLEQRKHILSDKPMDTNRSQIRVVERQRIFSPHLESVIFDSEIRSVCRSAFFGEVDVAEIETSRFFLEADLGELRIHCAVDVLVCGRLVLGKTAQEVVQVGRLEVPKLIAQDQCPLLRLVEAGQCRHITEVSWHHLEGLCMCRGM